MVLSSSNDQDLDRALACYRRIASTATLIRAAPVV